jgi:ribosome-binding protein aMBF1 (putative translation factor)
MMREHLWQVIENRSATLLIVRGHIDTNSVLLRAMVDRRDVLKRFGARVRELRSAKGFSQESFAAHCGLDRTYLGGVERGERNLALRNIAAINP